MHESMVMVLRVGLCIYELHMQPLYIYM